MKRIRWFAAEWPLPLRAFAYAMNSNPFTRDSSDGFIVDRIRDDLVEARYIEKTNFQEKIRDPFGNEQIFDYTKYYELEFQLFSSFPNIQLIDSPRNTQGFVNKLLEFANFDIAVTPVTVNVLNWINAFQRRTSKPIVIDMLQITGIEFGDSINGKILIKGKKDVRDSLEKLPIKSRYTIERAQLKVPIEQKIISIQLTYAGNAKINGDYSSELMPTLRNSLSDAYSLT